MLFTAGVVASPGILPQCPLASRPPVSEVVGQALEVGTLRGFPTLLHPDDGQGRGQLSGNPAFRRSAAKRSINWGLFLKAAALRSRYVPTV